MKSKPTGFLTIEGPYARSILPSIGGNIGGNAAAEITTASLDPVKIYQDLIRFMGLEK
jgi:hypothetical protein